MMHTQSSLLAKVSNQPSAGVVLATRQPTRRSGGIAPRVVAPVASGAMPQKVFQNPKTAIPMKPYHAGLSTLAQVARRNADTGGRVLQRGTR